MDSQNEGVMAKKRFLHPVLPVACFILLLRFSTFTCYYTNYQSVNITQRAGISGLQVSPIPARNLKSSNRRVTLFQAIDSSFFIIWLNWWMIALEFKAVPHEWDLHIACFGTETAEKVKLFHAPGCTKVYDNQLHVKQIYLAKWTAVVDAYRKGNDLLIVDIDALMIRNPLAVLQHQLEQRPQFRLDNQQSFIANARRKTNTTALGATAGRNSYPLLDQWDIVSSRDHGPANLPYSHNWGKARLCTGLILLHYSPAMLELVEFNLARCRAYGHDQIQFNTALARSCMVWDHSPEEMDDGSVLHKGFIPWFHQKEVDFLAIQPDMNISTQSQQRIVAEKLLSPVERDGTAVDSRHKPVKLNVLLMDSHTVMRYCNYPQRKSYDWIRYLKALELTPTHLQRLSVLHCFVAAGPVGEQGADKKRLKVEVMRALNLWAVHPAVGHTATEEFLTEVRRAAQAAAARGAEPSNLLLQDSAATRAMHARFKDAKGLKQLERVWLKGQYSAYRNPVTQAFFSRGSLPKSRTGGGGVGGGGGGGRKKRASEGSSSSSRGQSSGSFPVIDPGSSAAGSTASGATATAITATLIDAPAVGLPLASKSTAAENMGRGGGVASGSVTTVPVDASSYSSAMAAVGSKTGAITAGDRAAATGATAAGVRLNSKGGELFRERSKSRSRGGRTKMRPGGAGGGGRGGGGPGGPGGGGGRGEGGLGGVWGTEPKKRKPHIRMSERSTI